MSKIYEVKWFLKIFPESWWSFIELKVKTLIREKWQQRHHWLMYGLWSTTHCPHTKINSIFSPSTSAAAEKRLAKSFGSIISPIHSPLYNMMFIFNGISRCCNDTHWRPLHIAASKDKKPCCCMQRSRVILRVCQQLASIVQYVER